MPTAGQALLFDRIQGEYVVVRTGDFVQGFRVDEIEPDQVVLTHPDAPSRFYVLPVVSELRPMGERTVRCSTSAETPAPKVVSAPHSDLDLIDPYAQNSASDTDSYPGSGTIPTVLAPPDQRASTEPATTPERPGQPATTTAEPGSEPATAGQPSAPPAPGGDAAAQPSPRGDTSRPRAIDVPATVVQPPAETTPLEESRTIRRAEFDRALADFHALSKEVQISIRAGEVHIEGIASGSYFHRLGLRKGDVLVNVAGQPVGSLDAAASVYAKLMTTTRFTVVVKRGARRVTLHYRFTD